MYILGKLKLGILLNASIVLTGFFSTHTTFAQIKDSTTIGKALDGKKNGVFSKIVKVITCTPQEMLETDTVYIKSEAVFLPYDGKGIRNIYIRKFGFEKTFQDSSKRINYFGTKILNSIHNNTKAAVVRNNLFFKEKTKLDAYLLADNERYLRTLDYIQDARILVAPVLNEPDSVDITIITKDFFSISGSLDQLSPNKFQGKLSDANFAGMGQKLEATILLDKNRTPDFGYDFRYTKNNISGTYINATIGRTTMNRNIGNNIQNEYGWFTRFEKPLVSANTNIAGALSVAYYSTKNSYAMVDSVFYKYNYLTYDTWIGYNIGARHFLRHPEIKNRVFVSARYLTNKFFMPPNQLRRPYDVIFNSKQELLGQVTFFKQLFTKANYIYAFGTTEDVPYGYNISFISGWYKQLHLSRMYGGVDANRYIITPKGYIIQYFMRSGGFLNQGKVEDAVFLLGTSIFSRIFYFDNVKMRQYFNLNYTKQFNRKGLYPLEINNDFGIPNFSNHKLQGTQRITLHSESSIFLRPKLFGFKFSPFLFGDASLFSPEKEKFAKSDMYYGLGGGVRIRNENLVFRTVELRVTCFPRRIEGSRFIKIGITSNFRFRYNTSYVKAPEIVQVNSDAYNSIN